jgi:hypothetical protein
MKTPYQKNLDALTALAMGAFKVPSSTPEILKVEHRCPTCHKAIKDIAEIRFMESEGECLSCEHVRGSL